MNSGKVRIYELSRELNLDNRDLLAICEQLNISVKSHSSTITDSEAERIRVAAEKYTAPKSTPVRQGGNSQTNETREKLPAPVQKKQQILEIRKPIIRPVTSPELPKRLALHRTPRTRQGYIEPLLNVGSALPLHMVLIPGGSFLMGSPANEPERLDREGPQHEVTVAPFLMGRYPVTQAQWRFVAGLSRVRQTLDPEPSEFKGKDDHPVEQVSWNDAVEFCARLAQHTNRPYRLPTEAEWEYACRAGTTTPFYFGKTLTDELANYNASYTYANGPKGEYRRQTTPVDSFGIANAFGLSEMHGNVWEWCQDHWHENYEGAPADGSAWISDEQAERVLRGGTWHDLPRYCRSASRIYHSPDTRDDYIGFRVVCVAPRTL
jgi:formylglycine-generating enzyme required for sulfatase activity